MNGGDWYTMGTFRVIPKEIKEQILERVKTSGLPITQIAKEHGVSDRTIHGWMAKQAEFFPSAIQNSHLKRKINELYTLVGKLTLELSKFKKNGSS